MMMLVSLIVFDSFVDIVFEYKSENLLKSLKKQNSTLTSESRKGLLLQIFTPLLLSKRIFKLEKNIRFESIQFGNRKIIFLEKLGFTILAGGQCSGSKIKLFLAWAQKLIRLLVGPDIGSLRNEKHFTETLTNWLDTWEYLTEKDPLKILDAYEPLNVSKTSQSRIETSIESSLKILPFSFPTCVMVFIRGKVSKVASNKTWKNQVLFDRSFLNLLTFDCTKRSTEANLERIFLPLHGKGDDGCQPHWIFVHRIFTRLTLIVIVRQTLAQLVGYLTRLINLVWLLIEAETDLEFDSTLNKIIELQFLISNHLSELQLEHLTFKSYLCELVSTTKNHFDGFATAKPLLEQTTQFLRQLISMSNKDVPVLIGHLGSMCQMLQAKLHFYWRWIGEEEPLVLCPELKNRVSKYRGEPLIWILLDSTDGSNKMIVAKHIHESISTEKLSEIVLKILGIDFELDEKAEEGLQTQNLIGTSFKIVHSKWHEEQLEKSKWKKSNRATIKNIKLFQLIVVLPLRS